MPEYSYKCLQCGHELSVTKRIAEASREEVCPVCDGETRRVWVAPSVPRAACVTTGGGGGG